MFGIAAHFDDIGASVFVERDCNGVTDQRFGRDEFHSETGFDFERTEGIGGFDWRYAFQFGAVVAVYAVFISRLGAD
ncbi:MAG: hypothetical protein AMXMBFR4_06000 [Candidatus Hydrogenedentota bacterium]